MSAECLHPRIWLAEHPLAPGERLYAMFGSASRAAPLDAWRRLAPASRPHALWEGTAYAGWKPVMPYLAEVPDDGAFLDWCASTDARDWGWLAVSSHSPEVLTEHWRSLTQVVTPSGDRVFFRFWDGHYLLPAIDHSEKGSTASLWVFSRFWINGQARCGQQMSLPTAQPFPWWRVPAGLFQHLQRHDLAPVIGNLIQWLREEHPDIHFAMPEASLRHKVEQFARVTPLDDCLSDRLLGRLRQDLHP